jgi:hypothetical protein
MKVGRVDFSAWFLRLITWDGVVPILIALAPLAVELSIPNNRGVMEVAAVALPIAAFFIRLCVGGRLIRTNNCPAETRRLQAIAFVFGLFLLGLFDSVLILSHLVPNGVPMVGPFLIVLGGPYLVAMAIALYPGRVWKLDFSRAWRGV